MSHSATVGPYYCTIFLLAALECINFIKFCSLTKSLYFLKFATNSFRRYRKVEYRYMLLRISHCRRKMFSFIDLTGWLYHNISHLKLTESKHWSFFINIFHNTKKTQQQCNFVGVHHTRDSIEGDVTRALRHLIPPAARLFVQKLLGVYKRETIKALHLLSQSTGNRWIRCTLDQNWNSLSMAWRHHDLKP